MKQVPRSTSAIRPLAWEKSLAEQPLPLVWAILASIPPEGVEGE
jgi:hypothetical protein